ncbi:GNAT family N-acetyltransferase [Longispora sp. NPDC051575]|uniref:GNAT family N-acetyltransferase n=1 Tax=Longispora sp. NPDC051575 TaxID=3154943 RepID=UPI00343F6D46
MEPRTLTAGAAERAAADIPYLRAVILRDGIVTGWSLEGSLLVVAHPPGSAPRGQAIGDPGACAALIAHARDTGVLSAGHWVNGPRGVDPGFEGRVHEWDFRWTVSAPPALPGTPAARPDAPGAVRADPGDAVRLDPGDSAEIDAVLDLSLPESSVRPGDADAVAWYGIRVAGRLAAVAADVSPPGFGVVSGIAVHPAHQGLGLGGALTAAVTRVLLTEHGIASLGVYSDNSRASALYERLGYRAVCPRTAGMLASSDSRVRGPIPG